MVTLALDWIQDQQAFSTSIDQPTEYMEAGFELLATFLRAGWAVERSSNGLTFGASNLITSAAQVRFGVVGVDHAWVTVRPPTGKGAPVGDEYAVTIDFLADAGAATPQAADLVLQHGTVTSGSLTDRPTASAACTPVTLNLIPWAAVVGGSVVSFVSSDGDLLFFVKDSSNAFFRNWIIVFSDPVEGIGPYRMMLGGYAVGAEQSAVTGALLRNTFAWRAFQGDGAEATNVEISSVAFDMLWTNGAESTQNLGVYRDVEGIGTSGAGSQRIFGFLRDCRGLPEGTPFNILDDNDDGGAAPFELRMIGALAVPSNATIA